jgi:hypothetical protein
MKTTTDATKTEQVIFDMLTENTGTHFLDSGGDDGRHWQRNAKKTLDDFLSEPYATIDPKYGDVSVSTFHYLAERLVFAQGMTEQFQEFAKEYKDESWREVMALFVESLGIAEQDRDSIEDQTWEFNSYNFDRFIIGQTLQGRFFTIGNTEYLMLQIHGGADVRGGYTAPKVFTVKDDRYSFVLEADSATFCCNREECDNKLRVYEGGYTAELETETDEEDTTPEKTPACPCGGAWVS